MQVVMYRGQNFVLSEFSWIYSGFYVHIENSKRMLLDSSISFRDPNFKETYQILTSSIFSYKRKLILLMEDIYHISVLGYLLPIFMLVLCTRYTNSSYCNTKYLYNPKNVVLRSLIILISLLD